MPNFRGLLRKPELYDGSIKSNQTCQTFVAFLENLNFTTEVKKSNKKTFHCVKAEFSICCCVYTCCYTFCPRHYHASNTALLARHIVVVHTLKSSEYLLHGVKVLLKLHKVHIF